MKRFLLPIGVVIVALFTYFTVSQYLQFKSEIDEKDRVIRMKEMKFNDLKTEKMKIDEELQDSNSEKQKLENERKSLNEKAKELEAQLQAKKTNEANKVKLASVQRVASTPAVSGDCVTYARQAGITNPIAHDLIGRENRQCNPCIYNDGSPTGAVDCNYSGGRAYGIPQSLPGNKMASAGADWRTNPVTQLRWMQSYVMDRYKSWEGAKQHHDAMGWY